MGSFFTARMAVSIDRETEHHPFRRQRVRNSWTFVPPLMALEPPVLFFAATLNVNGVSLDQPVREPFWLPSGVGHGRDRGQAGSAACFGR